MAKQSFKNTIYQQITNNQVQQVIKEQRDQDFKMAQDLIAQYQPTNDDMAMAQNLIAQYQQPAPQPAPIKQSTVNEVKAESAPTQQIPSIEDFFKVKTASGKDVNKESAKFIQRNSYARQQQMENELASKSAKKSKEEIIRNAIEDKEVKPFVPQADIEDQNSVNDYRKNLLGGTEINGQSVNTERNELDELAKVFKASMKDYNPKFTAAGKRWENPYDSLTDEQKQLVREYIIQNQNNTNLSKEERETLKAFNRAYNSSDEEKDSRYNGRAAYLNSKNDFERGLQSLAGGFTDFNMPVAELLGKGFSKLPILNQIDYEKSRDDTREYINESKALNPQAAEAGRSLGQIYDYAVTSPFVSGIGEAAKLGKVGTAALNQVVQAGQDFGLDIYPEIQRMLKEEGKIDLGELAKRFGTDVVQNIVMESAPFLAAANYDSLVKSIGNNADIFKNIDATGALKNAPDAIRSVADATNNIKSATSNEPAKQIIPGMETESDVVNNINNDFSRLMGMYQPERTAMKNIYSAEDLNNSLNSQLANALKANQADEVAESVAKAMPETPMNSVANTVEDATKTADNVSAIKTEISDMTDTVIDRIYNVGYKVDAVNDEALNKSYRELLDYNEKWAKAISNSTDMEEIKRATKDLNNAISRFNTKAKKIDPSIAKDIYNRKFSSMLNSFNTRLDDYYNGAKRSKEATDLILGNQSDDALKEISELQNSKQALFDDVRNGRISARDYSYRMNEINRAESKLIDKYPDWYDNGTLKGTLEDYVPDNAAKTMTEEISKPKNDIITSEPVEPGKYEIPDTPENAPIGPGGGSDDYVSQFRTHNEQNFNMTDEELNNKYFNTQNENFHFLKGNRADDLVNATKSLENDYEGTVRKLINKPRDTQFTPQEVDEGFMAWNKELKAGRETGDYSKAADIMYRMTQDSHDKGVGLNAYLAWKKNSPAGVVLDANEAARNMAISKYGDKYIKNMDELTKKIDDILKNGDSLESQANQIDTLIKNLKGKGYRNGVKGADELKIALANGQLNSIVDVHDILYNANKIPNLSAKAQSDIAGIASEIYAKELTDVEKAKYINQINMILSQERNWSIKDKAIELSHILMLSGMRTHEKNIIANIGMLPQEALARKISALGQNAYALIDKDFKPTQAFHVSKGSKELAEKMFEAKGGAASIVEGIADKYTNRLADRIGATYMFGKMGKKNIAAKAGDKLLDTIPGLKKLDDTATELANKALKKIGSEGAYDAMDANVSVLENYRQAIYGSLSGLEDNPFVKENFVQRLASYIEAQNIKSIDDIPEEALDIARAEAVKATFKDDNAITELFSSIKKLPGIGELMLPFTKTPANLLARMIDFSPIGLARELLGVVNKNSRFARETVGETIDAISKGIGGSLTMALGMYLYANGILTGKKDDDANIANYMTNEGWQQYSVSTKGIADFINKYLGTDIDLGDSYHDFSFMQPSTTNFITGIELWDELMDGKKISDKTVDDIFNRVKSIGGSYTDALLAQSTLQNVSELFGSQYSDDGVGGNLMQNAIEWPTRFVSGAISDTAKLSDDTRREYYSKNKPIDTMKNAVMSKLPILSKQLPAKYDVFGNEMTRNKSEAGKWFNTLGNPTTSSYRSDDPLYDYVDKLNAESKEGDYVPTKYGRYVKLNDETKLDLDNKQYSELTRVTGETRAKLLKEAQNSTAFNNLSPDEKVGILDSLENIAKYEGFNAITDKAKITDETQKVVDMYKEGGVDGIVNNTIAKGIVKDSGISSNSKAAEAITEAVNKGDMEEANRLAKIEENYNKACEIAGVEEKSSGTRKAWEDGGTTGLKEYVAKQKLYEKYDLENDSTSRAVYDNWGEDGLKDLQTFKEQGIKGSTVVGIYQSAKSEGSVPSIKDFATTYKKMDGYGDSNGNVSQKEFVAYLEKNGINSQEEAQRLATIYGDWSAIPVLGKKGWQFKKTK